MLFARFVLLLFASLLTACNLTDPYGWDASAGLLERAKLLEGLGGAGVRGGEPADARPAPDFALQSLDGRTVTLAEFRGHPLVLYFWGTWCAECVEELPSHIAEVDHAFRERGLVILAVNVRDSADAVTEWVAQNNVTLPVLIDKDARAWNAYRAKWGPWVVIIDRDGRLVGQVKTRIGEHWTSDGARALFDALLKS